MSRPAAALPAARVAVEEWRRHATPGLAPWVLMGWAMLSAAAVMLRPLLPIDETRYLAVALEMWRSGDPVSLQLNGLPYGDKPPLLFWLIQLGWRFTGPGRVWPQLMTGLCALVALGLAVRLAAKVADASRAGLVALVTGSMLGWMAFTGAVMFDLLLACCVLLALDALVDASREAVQGRTGLAAWTTWTVALAAGLLAKGPVMLLHVLPVALLAPWWCAGLRAVPWYPRLIWTTVAGLVALAAWALPSAAAGGAAFSHELLWQQTWGRVATTTHHLRPVWFYLVTLPLLLLPWTSLPAVWRGARARWRGGTPMAGRRFLVAWILPVFLAFSAFRGKQAQYLLPLAPAFAMLLLHALAAAWGEALRPRVLRVAAASWVAMLLLVAGLDRVRGADYDMAPVSARLAALEAGGASLAQLGKYHGQFHYAGRLRSRIEEMPTVDALRAWAAAHPVAAVINYCDRAPKGTAVPMPSAAGPDFEQGFREKRLQLWSAAAFAALPASDDACRYAARASPGAVAVRVAAASGEAGSSARVASAAAASVAFAQTGAVQPNQSGSSSNASAQTPTRSISKRRAEGRSSSARPTPTAAAVITSA